MIMMPEYVILHNISGDKNRFWSNASYDVDIVISDLKDKVFTD